MQSPTAMLRFVLMSVVGLALDQWTKVVAFRRLATSTTGYAFIPGWLHFQITWNPGAVFGIGAGHRVLFLMVSAGAILFISYLFATSGRRQSLYHIILGMLLAGVLGNMYDRIVFGRVRDLIYIFPDRHVFGREVFPWIFNVADSLLCVGVALMMIYSLAQSRPRGARTDRQDKTAGHTRVMTHQSPR